MKRHDANVFVYDMTDENFRKSLNYKQSHLLHIKRMHVLRGEADMFGLLKIQGEKL